MPIEPLFPPVAADEVARFEAELPAPLPDDYRAFLERQNGGMPDPNKFRVAWVADEHAGRYPRSNLDILFGLGSEPEHADLRHNREILSGSVADNLLPIGLDPAANRILLGLSGDEAGRVYLWVNEFEPDSGFTPVQGLGFVADSFSALINGLHAP